MKTFLAIFLLCAISLQADQISYIDVTPHTASLGGSYYYFGVNQYTNGAYSTSFSSPTWLFYYNLSTTLGNTSNSIAIPTNGTSYVIYTNGIPETNSGMPVIATFYTTNTGPNVILYTNNLVNFWATNGSTVLLTASGYNLSSAGSNVFLCQIASNSILTAKPAVGRGNQWTLTGTLTYDGTNLNTYCQYSSGDTNAGIVAQITTITNLTITNVPLALAVESGYDTNLTLNFGNIYSTRVIPPALTPAALSFVSAPTVTLPTGTWFTNSLGPILYTNSVANPITSVQSWYLCTNTDATLHVNAGQMIDYRDAMLSGIDSAAVGAAYANLGGIIIEGTNFIMAYYQSPTNSSTGVPLTFPTINGGAYTAYSPTAAHYANFVQIFEVFTNR